MNYAPFRAFSLGMPLGSPPNSSKEGGPCAAFSHIICLMQKIVGYNLKWDGKSMRKLLYWKVNFEKTKFYGCWNAFKIIRFVLKKIAAVSNLLTSVLKYCCSQLLSNFPALPLFPSFCRHLDPIRIWKQVQGSNPSLF